MTKFEITKSIHGLPCITASDMTAKQRDVILSIMRDAYIDSPAYALRVASGAFLQGLSSDGWILIEFWNRTSFKIEEFVNFVNKRLEEA